MHAAGSECDYSVEYYSAHEEALKNANENWSTFLIIFLLINKFVTVLLHTNGWVGVVGVNGQIKMVK